jgi:hypothetical protein
MSLRFWPLTPTTNLQYWTTVYYIYRWHLMALQGSLKRNFKTPR